MCINIFQKNAAIVWLFDKPFGIAVFLEFALSEGDVVDVVASNALVAILEQFYNGHIENVHETDPTTVLLTTKRGNGLIHSGNGRNGNMAYSCQNNCCLDISGRL